MKSALMLTSGGIDCVTAAVMLMTRGWEVSFLNFCYGQRAAAKETEMVSNLARLYKAPFLTMTIGGKLAAGLSKNTQTDPGKLTGSGAFVPGRNLVFLAVAASIAEREGISHLAHGNILDGIYPDNRPAFTRQFNHMLQHSLGPKRKCVACLDPVGLMSKQQVVREAVALNVPLEWTWSCYLGGKRHCGECASCLGRRRAFAAEGLQDRIAYTCQ